MDQPSLETRLTALGTGALSDVPRSVDVLILQLRLQLGYWTNLISGGLSYLFLNFSLFFVPSSSERSC